MIELNGETIRRWRQRNGLTQENFAHDLGIDQSVVSRWEHSRQLPDLSYRRILRDKILLPAQEQRLLTIINMDVGRRLAVINGTLAAASPLLLRDHDGTLKIGDRVPNRIETMNRDRLDRVEAEIGRPAHKALLMKFNAVWRHNGTNEERPCMVTLVPGLMSNGHRLWLMSREPYNADLGDRHEVVLPEDIIQTGHW